MASTSFSALNTLLLGIIRPPREVAYWGLHPGGGRRSGAVYPITDSLYPVMVRERRFSRIVKAVRLFSAAGSGRVRSGLFSGRPRHRPMGGQAYAPAARIFRYLIPVLFFSFFALLFGWPTPGAIDCNAGDQPQHRLCP